MTLQVNNVLLIIVVQNRSVHPSASSSLLVANTRGAFLCQSSDVCRQGLDFTASSAASSAQSLGCDLGVGLQQHELCNPSFLGQAE